MLMDKKLVEQQLGKKIVFEKKFEGKPGETFSAYNEACEFLKSKGFDYGSMQREAPIGVAKNAIISKWRNLEAYDKKQLEGVMLSLSFRDLPVTVMLVEAV